MKCIYVIKGEDDRLINDTINLIIKEESLNEPLYRRVKEDGLSSILMELSMGSLFDEDKFIIILDGENIKNANEKDYNNLLNLMTNDSNNALAIVLPSQTKDDKIDNLTKKFNTISAKIQGSISDYIRNYINTNGYSANIDVIDYICQMNKNIGALINICDELFLYKLEDKIITISDIEALISRPLDDNVFDLVNAVMNKDKKKAYQIYQELKINNVTELMLISLLSNRFNQLIDINTLNVNGYSQDDIAKTFDMKPGRVYYLLKDLKSYSENSIKNILNDLDNLEYKIKRGLIAPGLGFELFLLEL